MNAFQERLYEHDSQVFTVDAVPHRSRTAFQDVLVFENRLFGRVLTLQLQQSAFEVSLLCDGLMSAPPSRPRQDEGWLNAPLRQADRYAPDFLDRPGNLQASR